MQQPDGMLLDELACPVEHAPVREEDGRIVCTSCGLRFRVRDGIPVMLERDAERTA